jgi:hypothetical protein
MKIVPQKFGRIARVAAIAAITTTASASVAFADFNGDDSVGIKFYNNAAGVTAASLVGVTAVESQNWNLTNGASGTFGTLVEDNGNGGLSGASNTSITGSWSAASEGQNIDNNNFGGGSFGSGNGGFMNGYLAYPSSQNIDTNNITINLANLGSEFSGGFDLYCYSVDETGSGFDTKFTVGSTSLTSTSHNGPTWINGGNYVEFTGLTGTTLSITATGVNNNFNYQPSVQAIEIVSDPVSETPVPEPSTYAMLLGGLLMLGYIARRRSNAEVL